LIEISARPPVLWRWVCGCRRQPHKSEFGIRILFKVGSNFVQKIPPIRKRGCWLALCEGSPADFRRKIEFFVFQNKVRADIFSGSLAVCLSASAFWQARAEGGSVFALPAAEPVNKIGSDFFKYTPPVGRCVTTLPRISLTQNNK